MSEKAQPWAERADAGAVVQGGTTVRSDADPLRDSPRMAAQRARIAAAFGAVAQRQRELVDEEPLQSRAAGAQIAAATAASPNEVGMPNQLKAGIEALSGMDMSDVRVRMRVRETMQMAGVWVNDDARLEREADVVGAAAQLATEGKRQDLTPLRPRLSPALAHARATVGAAVLQCFTRQQISTAARRLFDGGSTDHDKNWLDAKLELIADQHPEVDAGVALRESWLLRERYMAGESLKREDYKLMVRGLSEEELAEAVTARKLIKYRPKVEAPKEDSAKGGKRNWASGHMNDALEALRKQLAHFDTGHHKVSKSKLAQVIERMSSDQRLRAREVLDLAMEDSGSKAFKSLGSNVSSGPNSGLRLDEGGRKLDGNRDRSGRATPRTAIYEEIDGLLTTILAKKEALTGLSEGDYDGLVGRLVQAEKLHYTKTGGQLFDDDTSMWLEVPTELDKASYWVRTSVADAPPIDTSGFDGTTVRDLKATEYRSKRSERPKGSSIPRLFAGDHIERHDGVEYRFKSVSFGDHRYTLPGTVGDREKNSARAGYKVEGRADGHTWHRVDPEDLSRALKARLASVPELESQPLIQDFNTLTRNVVFERHLREFDAKRGGLVKACLALIEKLNALDNRADRALAIASAIKIVKLSMWFIEGDDSVETHLGEIVTILEGIG